MNPSMTEVRAWIESNPDYTNTQANGRSAANYTRALAQFEVETNPRYVRGHDGNPANGDETYCNIYLWDSTKAMGCEVPHWVDPATGVEVPMYKGKELSANGVCVWFQDHALDFGWMKCSRDMAQDRASRGLPTVVLWHNPKGIGHVAMVMPSAPGELKIAQSGAQNLFNVDLRKGFGGAGPLEFYTHE